MAVTKRHPNVWVLKYHRLCTFSPWLQCCNYLFAILKSFEKWIKHPNSSCLCGSQNHHPEYVTLRTPEVYSKYHTCSGLHNLDTIPVLGYITGIGYAILSPHRIPELHILGPLGYGPGSPTNRRNLDILLNFSLTIMNWEKLVIPL